MSASSIIFFEIAHTDYTGFFAEITMEFFGDVWSFFVSAWLFRYGFIFWSLPYADPLPFQRIEKGLALWDCIMILFLCWRDE